MRKLSAPKNINIEFRPSEKQYEVWKCLMPECPNCGGKIVQVENGVDLLGQPTYKPQCSQCGLDNIPQFIMLGGAAGGGKSYLMSCWIAFCCIKWPGIRAAMGRKTLKSLKASTVLTLRQVLRSWGIIEDENYYINNLESVIYFWNGSSIMLLEMADSQVDSSFNRFGSIEITCAAVDEISEISEKACEVLFSRIRYKVAETLGVPKMAMSTNPCPFWPRRRFIQDDDGNPAILRPGDASIRFTVDSNPDPEFRRVYMSTLDKISDPAVRARLRYGMWDYFDVNKTAAYWKFDGNVHLRTGIKSEYYDPMKPIIISIDFNVIPHMSAITMQVDYTNKKVYILEEILGKLADKENNTPAFAKKIAKKYLSESHVGGLIITGDPAGLARSTQTEDGVNNFTIIMNELSAPQLHAVKKLLTTQPPQIQRLEFVNGILDGFDGWDVKIDMACRQLATDLMMQSKNEDGTKEKKKILDTSIGMKYEKYGHLSDCLDYAFCYFLGDTYSRFKKTNAITTVITSDATAYDDTLEW